MYYNLLTPTQSGFILKEVITMSAPQTMFDSNTDPKAEQPSHQDVAKQPVPEVPNDPYAGMLQSITNPEGQQKYATVSDALNALTSAQQHIADLEARNNELSATAEQVATFEQRLNDMQKAQSATAQVEPQPSTESLTELVNQTINQRDAVATKQQNLLAVDTQLKDTFGEEAPKALQAKASELGMTLETMKGLAETNPKAVLAYFTTTSPQTTSNQSVTPTSTLRPDPNQTNQDAKKAFHKLSYNERSDISKGLREEITKQFM